jgi:CHAT domain-containing protein
MTDAQKALSAFVDAHTWEESREILLRHPELLTDEVDALLENWATFYDLPHIISKKGRTSERVWEHQEVLRHCRRKGVDIAFSKREGRKQVSIQTLVDNFMHTDTINEIYKLLNHYPELLTREVLEVIESKEIYSLGFSNKAGISERRTLLRLCQEFGIERAIDMQKPENGLLHIIVAFLNINDLGDSRFFVENNPDLLTHEADKILGIIIDQLKDDDDITSVVEMRNLLNDCRRLGVAATYVQYQRAMNLYELLGSEKGSLEEIESALGNTDDVKSLATRDYAVMQVLLLKAYWATDDPQKMARAAEIALDVIRLINKEDDPDIWRESYYILGAWYNRLPYEKDSDKQDDNKDNAIKCFLEALSVCNKYTQPDAYATLCGCLGSAYLLKPRDSDDETRFNLSYAIRWFKEVIGLEIEKIQKINYINALIGLANAHELWIGDKRKQYLYESLNFIDKAISLIDPEDRKSMALVKKVAGMVYFNLLKLGNLKVFEIGKRFFEEAFELYGAIGDTIAQRGVAVRLGDLGFYVHDWDLSRESYLFAIRRHDDDKAPVSDEPFLDSKITRKLAFSILQQGMDYTYKALEVLELGKARLINRELIRQISLYGAEESLRDLYHKSAVDYNSAQQDMKAADPSSGTQIMKVYHPDMWMTPAVTIYEHEPPGASPRAKDAIEQYRDVLNRVKRSEDAYVSALEKVNAKTFSSAEFEPQVYELLANKENMAIVVPLITIEGSSVFVIYDNQVQTISIPQFNSKVLNDLVGWGAFSVPGSISRATAHGYIGAYSIRHKHHDIWMKALEDTLKFLGKIFWEPVLANLPDTITRLAVVPQSDMWVLPLHAAILTPERRKNKNLPYLLDYYEINYYPSMASIVLCREMAKTVSEDGLLAIINPTEDSALRWSWLEVETIRQLFNQSVIMKGKEATREAVLNIESRYGYLHVASHGRFNWLFASESGLQVSDDWIVISDILTRRWDLRGVRLVTLSACETSIFDVRSDSDDDIISFPGAFLLSGVPCVVGSLWAVDDLSTTLLMQRFYRNHLKKGMSITEALRDAMKWIRNMDKDELLTIIRAQPSDTRFFRDALNLSSQYTSNIDRPFAHPFFWSAFTCIGY